MKRENYQILMLSATAAMVLVPVVPCAAAWIYITSDVCDDDPNGYYYESGGNYELEEE